MAKFLSDAVFDAGLAVVATCTKLTFCSAQPANFAGIAAVKLADVILTAGAGNGDYVIADHTTGRKVTVGAQTNVTPTGTGNVTWAILDDGATLHAATSVTSFAVTSGVAFNSPAFIVGHPDPV